MSVIVSIKDFVKQEKAKMLANLHNPDYELSDLVAGTGMSRSKYIATFKFAFGKTPIAKLNELRLKKGARMIANTESAIGRISAKVGYKDRHYFSRCFHTFFGITTTEYREQHRKK